MSSTPPPPESVEVNADNLPVMNGTVADLAHPMETENSVEASPVDNSHLETDDDVGDDFLSHLEYRKASPTDILKCVEIVKASTVVFTPPVAGSSSKNALQYRQHHAAPYFRCAMYGYEGQEEHDEEYIIGYITGLRLSRMRDDDDLIDRRPHDPTGPILAIRSVVIREEYRDRGLGMTMMKQYLQKMQQKNESSLEHPISKIVLLCTQEFLMFYIHCGFSVLRLANTSETKKDQEGEGNEPPQQLYYLEKLLIPPPAAVYESRRRSTDQREFNCFIVDSFAAAPGGGNPAAVVILPAGFDHKVKTKWMQMVAAEFNLAETAFCWPKGTRRRTDSIGSQGDESIASVSGKKESRWNIRYYTPKVEMTLCGHATLASAAVLYQTLIPKLLLPSTAIVFHASEDVLTMRLADDETASARVSRVSMDFPPKPPTELSTRDEKATVRNMLKNAFSTDLEPLFVGLSDMGDILVELTPETFNEIGYDSVNYKAFFEWDGYYRGVVICCVAPPETTEESSVDSTSDEEETSCIQIDFFSRFFCPKAGINEDPVTGSAHCTLGPYFSEKLGKEKVIGRQMSARSGVVECYVTPDNITLTGTAITTMNGRLAM